MPHLQHPNSMENHLNTSNTTGGEESILQQSKVLNINIYYTGYKLILF